MPAPTQLSTADADRFLIERMRYVAMMTLAAFVVCWGASFYPYDDLISAAGTPLGADYAMFYVSGRMILEGQWARLYQQADHQRRLHALFPDLDPRTALPFRYPPFVALLMAPLAALPYPVSFAVFSITSCAAWWCAVWILAGHLQLLHGPWRRPVLWAIAGWPVALGTLFGGQASMFALLIVAGSIVLLKGGRHVAAGAVLALAAYKPNVLAFFALGCMLRYPRAWRGAVPMGCVWLALSYLAGGWQGITDYLHLGTQLATTPWGLETPPWKVHSLLTWITPLWPEHARLATLSMGLLVTVGIAWRWRSCDRPDQSRCWVYADAIPRLRWGVCADAIPRHRAAAHQESPGHGSVPSLLAMSLLLIVGALFNPYAPIYDLTLLLAASLLTAESLLLRYGVHLRSRLWVAVLLLATLYFGPHVSETAAQLWGMQPFALCLLVIGLWQARDFFAVTRPTDHPAGGARRYPARAHETL